MLLCKPSTQEQTSLKQCITHSGKTNISYLSSKHCLTCILYRNQFITPQYLLTKHQTLVPSN